MNCNVLQLSDFNKSKNELDSLKYEEAIKWLAGYYSAVLSYRCPPIVLRQMLDFLKAGAKPSLIRAALDAASVAPRPSWQYARAIIGNCIATGYFDADDFERRQRVFWSGSAPSKWDDLM